MITCGWICYSQPAVPRARKPLLWRVPACESGRTGRAGTWDLTEHGMPYGLAVGPYGVLLALTWQRQIGGVNLVQLDRQRPGA